jgi:glycerol uptake facilitator-like aquaporin
VLITSLGPISGAHFNPAVSTVFALRRELSPGELVTYVLAQIAGGIAGVLIAHGMFDEPLLQLSTKARSGPAQWLSEAVAAFGLVLTIVLTLRAKPAAVAGSVGLYITAAYWFTASTSFANPAVTLARALSDTFAGIRPVDVAPFIVAQLAGAMAAMIICHWLVRPRVGA